MHIFDNIGCTFIVNDNNNFVILNSLPGYNSLNDNHVGCSIPYLVRNIVDNNNIEWEIGSGTIEKYQNTIIVSNRNVISSSNNNNPTVFSSKGNKQFYLFVNSLNFNTGFNNVSIKNNNFTIDNRKTVYIVDTSSGYIQATLNNPSENKALEIFFKAIGSGSLSIQYNNETLLSLSNDDYASIISTGENWIVLDSNNSNKISALSSDPVFSAQSNPDGADRSLQYNDGGSFAGSNAYFGNNNKILLGSSTEDSAKVILPSSGSFDTIFNQTKDSGNFIVYGSGNLPNYPSKNLIFTHDGRFGLNMPSGIKPATVFHIINNICHEDLRLENKSSCEFPAHIALYKNPYSLTNADNATIGKVSFSSKNSTGTKITYASIEANTKSLANNDGQINIVVSDGNTNKTTISTNPDSTIISNVGKLEVSSSGDTLSFGNSKIGITSSNISIATTGATDTSIGLRASNIEITGIVSVLDSLKLNYITQYDQLLCLDASKRIIATTGFKIPGLGNQSAGKILTTTDGGTVISQLNVSDLWPYETGTPRIGGKDMSWSRFPSRSGQVCIGKTTKEIDLTTPAQIEEFVIGDQIAINNLSDNTIIYNIIEDIFVTDDQITGLVVEESVNLSGELNLFSITRGGILRNELYTSGVASDATAIQLSTRPNTPTIFNTNKKNIDFTVYGVADVPAINVFAQATVNTKPSGKYFKYSTQLENSDGFAIDPIPVKISVNGNGAGGANNTVNYQEAAYNLGSAYWSGMASVVGTNGRKSFYGTYDQNGNVYEWIEDDQKVSSTNSNQYICGGSWRTSDPNGLRGYIPTPRLSGFDDTGFRICSKAGFSDQSINDSMQFRFTSVEDINNLSDSDPLFTEAYNNRFTIKAEPVAVSKNNLGSVSYPFSIAETEITNKQYIMFLNSVATGASVNGLYDPRMSGTVYGGILREGNGSITPYSYSAKNGMLNMPVVYVNYLSALRFINWLNNGAPTGELVNSATTEDGSYYISESAGITSVTRKKDPRYWLPSLNEWHKAAYYLPLPTDNIQTSGSAITINRIEPFEYASGLISSLSISGNLYADSLNLGISGSELFSAEYASPYYEIRFGGKDTVVETDSASAITGTFGNVITNTGIIFATTGNTLFINKINPINVVNITPTRTEFYQPLFIGSGTSDNGGIRISVSGGLEYIGSDGTVVPGGMFPGPSGGFLFKSTDSKVVSSEYLKSEYMVVTTTDENGGVTSTTGLYPVLDGTSEGSIIHNSTAGYLTASTWFGVGLAPSQASAVGSYIVGIYKPSGSTTTGGDPELPPALYTDRIFVGPLVPGYSGSILTHNGTGPALWKQPDYLSAPGVTWTRYPKRAVEFIGAEAGGDIDRFKFISLDESKGGTGSVDLNALVEEFAYNETIAIYNQNRDVYYVKVANISLVDARNSNNEKDFFTNEADLVVTVCPPIPEDFYGTSQLVLGTGDTDNGRYVGYAFSVQKGGYLEMKVEPDAIEGFTCNGLSTDSEYRFKPSTINTISIRPNIYTTFNKIAEDIDFIVYGHRKTLFTRYEPEWFGTNENGVPSGLVPAFRVHASIPNSVLGSLESGIFRKTNIVESGQIVRATGIELDIKPKITVNMNSPYVITSLTGVYEGIISYGDSPENNLLREKEYGLEISSTGVLVSGELPLSNYADLSVDGYTYSKGLITTEVVLNPVWSGAIPVPYDQSIGKRLYVPNYPLTINSFGQIISLIPPPNPEMPGQPTNLIATAKYNAIALEWQAPENDGGKAIYAYLVEYYSDGTDEWLPAEQITSDGLPLVSNPATYRYIGNLSSTISYRFRVTAINTVGKSQPSDPTSLISPSTDVPSKPQSLSIVRNQYDAVLSWTAPANDGVSSRTGYIVSYWLDDGVTPIGQFSWITYNGSVSPSAISIIVDNILEGNTYFFKVEAVNIQGNSEPAEIRSIGTDGDPRGNQTEDPTFGADSFDFSGGPSGLGMMFTGVCY